MSDRTSAGIYGDVFQSIADAPIAEPGKRELAATIWSTRGGYDFSPSQMGVDDALAALGLARFVPSPDDPECVDVDYGPTEAPAPADVPATTGDALTAETLAAMEARATGHAAATEALACVVGDESLDATCAHSYDRAAVTCQRCLSVMAKATTRPTTATSWSDLMGRTPSKMDTLWREYEAKQAVAAALMEKRNRAGEAYDRAWKEQEKAYAEYEAEAQRSLAAMRGAP